MIRLLVLVSCLLCQLNVLADIVVTDVDLSGTDPSSRHTLRVAGTVSPDPVSSLLIDTSSRFFHQADAPRNYNSVPRIATGISFIGVPALTESPFERISFLDSFTSFQQSTSDSLLGALVNNQDVLYDYGGVVFDDRSSLPTSHGNSSGVSGGTSAIPEPGSLTLCVGLVGLGLVSRRRRSITRDP